MKNSTYCGFHPKRACHLPRRVECLVECVCVCFFNKYLVFFLMNYLVVLPEAQH